MPVPPLRIRPVNKAPYEADGDYVLYWMIAFRRTTWNYSLQRAIEWCRDLRKPLVVLEPLRTDYRWASDRLHRFVIEGMADNALRMKNLRSRGVLYYPYVEPKRRAGAGLLEALAERAAVVVTDDFPCFFLPQMVAAAASRLSVRMEAVDGNGLVPMCAAPKVYARAFDFRRWLQKNLSLHLAEDQLPDADPLEGVSLPPAPPLPEALLRRWPAAELASLLSGGTRLAGLPIDHSVVPAEIVGGSRAACGALASFLETKIDRYVQERNHPDADACSGLSPYLHFGHVSAHQVFMEATAQEAWSIDQASDKASGSNEGWWNASANLEAFLDQLVTWRELGFNFCWQRQDYDQYDSLPEWARKTLAKHATDDRPHIYTTIELENARTYDPLWNAAQRQLLTEGRIHNYLRMLWGKRVLEWSADPRQALDVLLELNNKYALDGRDPNSYSGIFWVLGRYDRAWGPERPIFGTIRYLSSQNTARKLRLKEYLRRYGEAGGG